MWYTQYLYGAHSIDHHIVRIYRLVVLMLYDLRYSRKIQSYVCVLEMRNAERRFASKQASSLLYFCCRAGFGAYLR